MLACCVYAWGCVCVCVLVYIWTKTCSYTFTFYFEIIECRQAIHLLYLHIVSTAHACTHTVYVYTVIIYELLPCCLQTNIAKPPINNLHLMFPAASSCPLSVMTREQSTPQQPWPGVSTLAPVSSWGVLVTINAYRPDWPKKEVNLTMCIMYTWHCI